MRRESLKRFCEDCDNFFLIGNQKTIINEKKGKVQVVHDDKQQENIEQTAQQKEKSGKAKVKHKLSDRRTISKTPTRRPLQKTPLA